MTGLSAAKREKLSPSLAIMAAVGKRSTQLDQSELLGSAVRHEAKRCSQLQLHPLTKMQRLELENRELKQALSALKIVQSFHPEQMSDHNMHGDVAQSSHSCPGRNEGIIRAPGAQHATRFDCDTCMASWCICFIIFNTNSYDTYNQEYVKTRLNMWEHSV